MPRQTDEEILVETARAGVKQKAARREAAARKLAAAQARHAGAVRKHEETIAAHAEAESPENERRAFEAAHAVSLLAGHVSKAQRELDAEDVDLRIAQSDQAERERELAAAERARKIQALRAVVDSTAADTQAEIQAMCTAYDVLIERAANVDARMAKSATANSQLCALGETVEEIATHILLVPIVQRLVKARPGRAPALLACIQGGPVASLAHIFEPSPSVPLGQTFARHFQNHLLGGDMGRHDRARWPRGGRRARGA